MLSASRCAGCRCHAGTTCQLLALALTLSAPLASAVGQQAGAPPVDTTRTGAPTATLARVLVADSNRARRSYSTRSISSATRTATILRDVPQSATIIGTALIADQGMRSMADVVRYVPGITMGLGEGHRDAPTIRGNSTTADFFIDGIRDDAQYYRDVYNVERVEALKGANAMVFGRGGGGGVLNRVTKEAIWLPTRTATFTGGSFEQRRGTADVGQGFGRHLAGRLNGLYERGATFRDASDYERTGINPTASLMVGSTLVRAGYEFYRDTRVVDRGLPSFQGAPAPAPLTTFFGDPAASQSSLTAHAVTASVDHALWRGNAVFDGVQLRSRSRVMTYDKFYSNVFPGAVNTNASSVALNGYTNGTDRTNMFTQTDITSTLHHGAWRQTWLVGAEVGRQDTENYRATAYFGAAGSTATSLTVPFDAPRITAPLTFRQSATDADNRTVLTTRALYAQNQIAIGSHVQAVAGLRFDRLTLDFTNNRTGQSLSRPDQLVSPRAGLVYKPVEPVSVYGSYSVSFLPSSGDQFSSLTVNSQALEPEQFTNREIGVKWDARSDLAVTGAIYQLDRTNTTAPDPLTPGIILQTGAQRTTGWELGVTGTPVSRWQIAGGFASQRATIISRTAAAAAGAVPPLVPRLTVSLWNRVQLTRRIGTGLGVVYQDRMFAAIDNTVTLPAFTRIDLAAFVGVTRALRAQVNIENLLGARYFPTAHSNNNIMPGSPRMVRIAMHVAP